MNAPLNITIKVNDLETVDQLIELGKAVFQTKREDEINKFYSRDLWLNKIHEDGILIGGYLGKIPVGFLFCDIREEGSLHIWLAGILEEYRGKGIWTQLFQTIEIEAKNRNYKFLTLNTFQQKFPVMYSFVSKNGFECFGTVEVIEDNVKLTKSLFRKKLD